MSPFSDRLADLLVGKHRIVTRRAFVLAGIFLVATSAVDYLVLLTKAENEFLALLNETFVLDVDDPDARGAPLVVGLAAIHAYLNEGYLPSLVLGWSPMFGGMTWIFVPFTQMEEFDFAPVFAFEYTYPEAVAFATLGFGIGLVLRWIHHQHYSDTPFSPGVGEESRVE